MDFFFLNNFNVLLQLIEDNFFLKKIKVFKSLLSNGWSWIDFVDFVTVVSWQNSYPTEMETVLNDAFFIFIKKYYYFFLFPLNDDNTKYFSRMG